MIADADGKIDSASNCRANHVKHLEGKLKSALVWLRKAEKSLKDSRKHYSGKWHNKKQSTNLKLFCYLDTRQTSWQSKRFTIHHKKRYITHLERQITTLKAAPIRVTISTQAECFFLGSKGETCGNLDFSVKKSQLRERGRKYARMLSNFAYSRFIEQLALQCGNAGIEVIRRNPAWSSFLALVKYLRMYGMSSDEAAAIVLARRAMNLSERLPRSITALLGVNPLRARMERD